MTRVPFLDLRAQHATIKGEVMEAALAIIEAQSFILGEPVARFERWLATACGAEHAVGVACGTDALTLGLRALGVGEGDAILTTPFSFIAAAEAIATTGARPIFCDIDPRTFNLSPERVEARLAECVRRDDGTLVDSATGCVVRGILPVHLYGRMAPMRMFTALAKRHGLFVLEDAAQAIGATEAGRPAGSFGDATAFSFFPSKNLGAWGDGGAIVTSRADVAARARLLRAHGSPRNYHHVTLGANSRLDALQAAVLFAKAAHLEEWTVARGRVAGWYRDGLEGLDVLLPEETDEGRHAYHQFVIRSPKRDALRAWLAEQGIEARVYYPAPLHVQPCFESLGQKDGTFPATEAAAKTVLSLPIYPELTERAVAHVVEQVARFVRG